MDWDDPSRKIAALGEEIRRLRARARRVGAPETAEALDLALARVEAESDRGRAGGAAAAPE